MTAYFLSLWRRWCKAKPFFIRHLDCGSCNGCDLELNALASPPYNIGIDGIEFTPAPRHAEALAVTGPLVIGLKNSAIYTLEAMPGPDRRIFLVGDCSVNGKIPEVDNCPGVVPDGVIGLFNQRIPNLRFVPIPGCPPSPDDILEKIISERIIMA